MMVALWQFDKEDLLAGLLLFRLLYYVIPFALALLVLGIREIALTTAARRARKAPTSALCPFLSDSLFREFSKTRLV